MLVRFWRAVRSAFQRKMVKGRVQILHSWAALVRALMRYTSRASPLAGAQPEGEVTYRAMILLQHLHIRVVWQALLAYRGKVGRLPAAAIQILLDLRRHVGGEMARAAAKVVCM
jgi:hypothetical protein